MTQTIFGHSTTDNPVKITVDSNGHLINTIADENGLAYGVKQIDGKPRVSSMPYLYDIAEGNVTGHVPFSKKSDFCFYQRVERIEYCNMVAYLG